MNQKKLLISILVVGIFFTGCRKEVTKNKPEIADDITQEKTMTKVQNDVTEIIDKDYEYVLQNMGIPYCTTYYINLDNINTIKSTKDLDDITLVYPKYTSNNELEGSALYIDLSSNKVKEVQTYEFSEDNGEIEEISDKKEVIINKYEKTDLIPFVSIENIKIEDYIGDNKEELEKIIEYNSPNISVHYESSEKNIKLFFLEKDNSKLDKMLVIFEEDNIINEIQVVEENKIINIVKSYLKEKA